MTTSAKRDRWVNAVVETWIPLDDVTPESSPAEKLAAAERAVDAVEIPEGLVHVVRWEDAPPDDDALRDQRQVIEVAAQDRDAWVLVLQPFFRELFPALGIFDEVAREQADKAVDALLGKEAA